MLSTYLFYATYFIDPSGVGISDQLYSEVEVEACS